jgi:gliding motility-associated-like protein/uncharacterized repeat protein (TIGR01451 family)
MSRGFLTSFSLALLLMVCWSSQGHAQVVEDFEIRYQAQQNGGIQFLTNTTMYCGTGSSCTAAQQAMPITGWPQDNNNGHSMEYFDGDNDPDTWCSSSDSLALGPCADISFAGLYWAGRLGNGFVPNADLRDQVKIRASEADPYIDVFAEEEIEFNASQVDNYCCYADVTDWVAANPINARYTVANVVSRQASSCWGGWVLVIVYEDALAPMRNLTLFDGLAMITGSGGGNNSAVDVPISGFLTPPIGPVDLQLGVVAFDGDRGEDGDQLGFNGTGNVEYISDATHDVNNAFNSTHSTDGTINPWRQPAFNNTLGHDANVFVPDNSNFEFLPNNATDASIRVTTGGESITVQVITSVIDVYEPDLRATVFIEDLNGGMAEPGDILEYTVAGKNLGSDAASGVYITETLDLRTDFVSGSLEWISGPLTGPMTDNEGDDPGEFVAADQMVRVRAGAGANATNGGTLDNDPLGMDSIAFRFQVQLTDDCLLLQCDGTLTGSANIYGEGNISGNAQSNDGASGLVDANGCPVEGVTVLDVQTGVCPPVAIEPSGTTCLGDDVTLTVPQFSNNPLAESLANYTWSGPDGYMGETATAFIADAAQINAGVYNLEVTFSGLECLLSSAAYTLNVHVPAPDFDPPESQCLEDNAFNFAGEGAAFAGATYMWIFQNGTPSISTGAFIDSIQFNTGGWHTVGLTLEEIGCTANVTDSIFVELPPVLTPFPIEIWPDTGCVPLIVNFADPTPAMPLDYSWVFGDGTSSPTDAPSHEYEQVGTYGITVSAVSLGNCPGYISFDVADAVTVLPNPEAGFEVNPTTVELLEPVVNLTSLTSTANAVSYWMSDGGSLGTPDGSYIFNNGGNFEVIQTVISPEGCTSTATAEVVVNGTIFHAPSAFTPNGDSVNDTWHPVALGVTSYVLEVRNRWGALVWSTEDAGEPWLGQVADGSHFVPDGTYHWKVTYRDQLGFPKVKQGTLTIFR